MSQLSSYSITKLQTGKLQQQQMVKTKHYEAEIIGDVSGNYVWYFTTGADKDYG